MTKEHLWALVYATVIGIRLHPANKDTPAEAIKLARQTADLAIKELECRSSPE